MALPEAGFTHQLLLGFRGVCFGLAAPPAATFFSFYCAIVAASVSRLRGCVYGARPCGCDFVCLCPCGCGFRAHVAVFSAPLKLLWFAPAGCAVRAFTTQGNRLFFTKAGEARLGQGAMKSVRFMLLCVFWMFASSTQ